jgi:hypothetical protein
MFFPYFTHPGALPQADIEAALSALVSCGFMDPDESAPLALIVSNQCRGI